MNWDSSFRFYLTIFLLHHPEYATLCFLLSSIILNLHFFFLKLFVIFLSPSISSHCQLSSCIFWFGSGKRRPKRCSFGISGTEPKPVQPLQFVVLMIELPVSGFWPIFLKFRFFQRTRTDKGLVPGWTGQSGPVFKTMHFIHLCCGPFICYLPVVWKLTLCWFTLLTIWTHLNVFPLKIGVKCRCCCFFFFFFFYLSTLITPSIARNWDPICIWPTFRSKCPSKGKESQI